MPPAEEQEIIGWRMNIKKQTIQPNDKGIRKLTFIFFAFNADEPQPQRLFQILSSLAERYSSGLRNLRPFVYPLQNMLKASGDGHQRRIASSQARFCIEVWRIVCVMLFLDKHSLSVSFNQVIRDYSKRCKYTVITDAGPKYLGIVVLSDDVLRGYGSFELPFHAEDPAFQNSREFMGYLGGVLLLLQVVETIEQDAFTLRWVGDNTSALSWVEKNKCGSCGTQSAFMALTWITLSRNVQLIETHHLAGRLMGDVDALSRRRKHSLPVDLDVDLDSQERWVELFKLCDPTVKRNLPSHHVALHQVAQALSKW